jgi:hypothetical protein
LGAAQRQHRSAALTTANMYCFVCVEYSEPLDLT